jgi:hypothetical protein
VSGGSYPEKQEKEKAEQAAAKAGWDLSGALMTLTGQALASSSSFKELTQNLMQAAGTFLNQLGSNLVGGGPFGSLVGGLLQFGWNMLTNRDEKLPIHDNALNSRIINWSDMVLSLTAVRDRSELAFARSYNESWRLAGARGA